MTKYSDNSKYAFYKISEKLVDIQRNLIFLHKFPRGIQTLNFMTIWREKSELFAIRKTDIAEKKLTLHNFANSPIIVSRFSSLFSDLYEITDV
jgi:hypothetical protein